nr:glycosyltransferase BC10-like [Ipomoea batatas]
MAQFYTSVTQFYILLLSRNKRPKLQSFILVGLYFQQSAWLMQLKVGLVEEGKDPPGVSSRGGQVRVLPQRLVHLLALFLFLCLAFSVVSIYMIKHYGVHNVVMAPLKPSLESCIGEEPSDLVVEEEAQNFGERNLIF